MFTKFLTQHFGLGYWYIPLAVTLALGFLSFKIFKNLLPKDQGRAFAVNGELSEGKPRGAGIIMITVFTFCVALFVPLTKFSLIYLACIYGAMITGYLDDAAEKPWGNVKKGLCDLVISLGVAFASYYDIGNKISITLTDSRITVPAPLYIFLAAVLVWTAINVTNCSDGVDGLCGSLVMTVLIVFVVFANMVPDEYASMIKIMIGVLIAYLWFNCSPSKLLMGDAGSRSLGVFLAVIFLQTGCPLLFIPMALIIILDGGLGLLKLSFRRFLKMKNFMEGIRTPLHDHARKNKGWSDTQVVTRFVLLQIIIDAVYLAVVMSVNGK